jgi:hypothetical protein
VLLLLLLQGKLHADTMAAIKAQLFHQPAVDDKDGEQGRSGRSHPCFLALQLVTSSASIPTHMLKHAACVRLWCCVLSSCTQEVC